MNEIYFTVIEDKFDVKFFSSLEALARKRIQDAIERCKRDKNKTGTKCFLTVADIAALVSIFLQQGGKCALTQYDLTLQKSHRHTASLDRIDSQKHYSLDNVQWACDYANNQKGRK
jgi:hypothetical protein